MVSRGERNIIFFFFWGITFSIFLYRESNNHQEMSFFFLEYVNNSLKYMLNLKVSSSCLYPITTKVFRIMKSKITLLEF